MPTESWLGEHLGQTETKLTCPESPRVKTLYLVRRP